MLSYPRIVIDELLVEHFDEVAFLWGQRREAVTSGQYRVADIAEMDRRMATNVRGLLAMGRHSLPLAQARLHSHDPDMVFAAGLVLLRLDIPRDTLLQTMSQVTARQWQALRDAFCCAWRDEFAENLQAMFQSAPPQVAIAAAEVLASQRRQFPFTDRRDEFLQHQEPDVRVGAWRIVCLLEN